MNEDKILNEVIADTQKNKRNIEWIASPNFKRSRKSIDMIVIRCSNTSRIQNVINEFLDKYSKASAHYIIGRDGRIIQMVQDIDKAWHAGNAGNASYRRIKNVNECSIGICLIGKWFNKFTEAQYQACAYICSLLVEKHDIKLERILCNNNLITNIEFENITFNWETFHSYLREECGKSIADTEPELENDKENNIELYSPDVMMLPGKDSESWFISLLR